MLDPQVQIRIIDLTEKWAELALPRGGVGSEEATLAKKIENFDKVYKAIVKTVTSE